MSIRCRLFGHKNQRVLIVEQDWERDKLISYAREECVRCGSKMPRREVPWTLEHSRLARRFR